MFSGQFVVWGKRYIHSDRGIHFEGRIQVFPIPWGQLKKRFHLAWKEKKDWIDQLIMNKISSPLKQPESITMGFPLLYVDKY